MIAADGKRAAPPGKVLVIQLGDIGDVVLATPTFRALSESFPHARVHALVRKPYGSLLSADPHLAGILEVSKSPRKFLERVGGTFRLARELRGAKYDLVVDLRTGDRGAILAFLTGAPARVGRHGDEKPFWHDLLFTRVIVSPPHGPPQVHPGGDQSLRVVREIGVDTEDSRPRLYVDPAALVRARVLLAAEGIDPDGRFATVNPFSRWRYKEWGHPKWSELIGRLWETHRLPTVVVGSREEADAAGAIVRGSGAPTRSTAGKTTLGELAAVLGRSSLHMGVDSAAPHIAAAVGTPSLTIFGPSDWRAWTVVDDLHRVVTPDRHCVPCHRKGCDGTERSLCLEELTVGEVLRAVEEILPPALARLIPPPR